MSVLSRITRKIERHGEEVLMNGTTLVKAVIQVLDTGKMRTYLDDTEVAMSVRPALYMVTEPDAPVAVNDTITRDSRVYTVRKVATERFSGTSVVKIAILT